MFVGPPDINARRLAAIELNIIDGTWTYETLVQYFKFDLDAIDSVTNCGVVKVI